MILCKNCYEFSLVGNDECPLCFYPYRHGIPLEYRLIREFYNQDRAKEYHDELMQYRKTKRDLFTLRRAKKARAASRKRFIPEPTQQRNPICERSLDLLAQFKTFQHLVSQTGLIPEGKLPPCLDELQRKTARVLLLLRKSRRQGNMKPSSDNGQERTTKAK